MLTLLAPNNESSSYLVYQADLWDDVAEALTRMFGKRVGGCCAAAFEIAAGETDLAADRVRGQANDSAEIFAAQKRRLITSRMIASQAVRTACDICSLMLANARACRQ